jgi:hypothetical protein
MTADVKSPLCRHGPVRSSAVFEIMQHRSSEETEPVTSTVDHADIRGLDTTLLVSVGCRPRSRHEGLSRSDRQEVDNGPTSRSARRGGLARNAVAPPGAPDADDWATARSTASLTLMKRSTSSRSFVRMPSTNQCHPFRGAAWEALKRSLQTRRGPRGDSTPVCDTACRGRDYLRLRFLHATRPTSPTRPEANRSREPGSGTLETGAPSGEKAR